MRSLGYSLIKFDWSLYKRGKFRQRETERRAPCEDTQLEGRWPCEKRSRDGSYAVTATECLGLPETRRGKGASLVAQWLRVCLPMQGTRVRALVWEDPTCRGATGSVSHNYWACASGASAPQQERPQWWEARVPRWRVAPTCHNWRRPSHRNEDPTQP